MRLFWILMFLVATVLFAPFHSANAEIVWEDGHMKNLTTFYILPHYSQFSNLGFKAVAASR